MKILVTGATRRVGNVLVKRLNNLGYDVYSFVIPFDNVSHIKDHSTLIYGNLLDPQSVDNALKGMDCCIHAGAMVTITNFNKRQVMSVNVQGTENVLTLSEKNNLKGLVYVSSVHAIPVLKKGQTMRETKSFDPKKVSGVICQIKSHRNSKSLRILKVIKTQNWNSASIGRYRWRGLPTFAHG